MNDFDPNANANFFIAGVGTRKKVSVLISPVALLTELTDIYSYRSSDAVIVYGDASESGRSGPTVAPPSGFDHWNS